MKISQKTLRTTKRLLSDIKEDQYFLLGLKITNEIEEILVNKLGISRAELNKAVLPSPLIGINSMRNADGEYIPDKTRDKEIAYRALDWTLTSRNGHTYSGTNYVPYERYPKKFIPPFELLLVIINLNDNVYVCIKEKFQNKQEADKEIKFAANLMLEIFKEVETLKLDNQNKLIEDISVEKVDWEILPSGDEIWEKIGRNIENHSTVSELKLIKERLEWLQSKKPTSIKEGIGGYTGYLVFEFKESNVYIMDSVIYGKATYVFENEWERFSKLTKKEILTKNLAKERVVHNDRWKANLGKYI